MSVATAFVSQTRYNLLATVRSGAAIALGVVMPVVFFLGASALFGSEAMGGNNPVDVRDVGEVPSVRVFYVGGFMAYAIIYSAFVALLPDLIDLRERGLLKRLRGTPLPLPAFVAARFAIALLITTITVVLLAVLAMVVFGIETPTRAWPALAIYTLLGTVTFSCLAFAATTFVRSPSAAQGVSNAVGLILAMISGVFFAPSLLPEAVSSVAQYLPLEPLANGFQTQYTSEIAGLGLDARNLAILTAWALVAVLLVAWRGFRWKPQQQR
jgi:ABC-2 type transport system permease protein